MNELDLNSLVVFAYVVKQGSFVGAAKHLSLPKATVSRRIQKLEESLQVKLLERSTRVVRPTEIGQIYYEYCNRIVTEIMESNVAIEEQKTEPQGTLRTSAPSAFTQLFIKDIIPKFLSIYPKINLVHRIVNNSVNPLKDSFDVSIRIGLLEDSLLGIQPLGLASIQLFASPKYLTSRDKPISPEDLVEHDLIVTGEDYPPTWTLFKGHHKKEIEVTPRCMINDPTLAFSLVMSGVGIGLLPTFLCLEAMKKDQLELILPEWTRAKVPLNAIFPMSSKRSPKVKVFLHFLKEALKTYDPPLDYKC